MTREEKLKAVWKNTHRDYRGTITGSKTIMIYRNGTCLVPLHQLTDEEIEKHLPWEMRGQPTEGEPEAAQKAEEKPADGGDLFSHAALAMKEGAT